MRQPGSLGLQRCQLLLLRLSLHGCLGLQRCQLLRLHRRLHRCLLLRLCCGLLLHLRLKRCQLLRPLRASCGDGGLLGSKRRLRSALCGTWLRARLGALQQPARRADARWDTCRTR